MYYWYYGRDCWPAHGDCPEQRTFLESARKYFQTKYYNGKQKSMQTTSWGWQREVDVWIIDQYWGSRKEEIIDWLYKWGRDYQVLSMSRDQLSRWLLDRDKAHTRALYSQRRRYSRWNQMHDGLSSYVKRPHHAKKDRSEEYNQKQEWRKKKGFAKDHGKTGWHRSCPKVIKRFCNKKHRQMERHCIDSEQYDKLHKTIPKNIFDPWMWD